MYPLEVKAKERFNIAINEELRECVSLEEFNKEELDAEPPDLLHYEYDHNGPPVSLPDREDLEDDHYIQNIGSIVLLPPGAVSILVSLLAGKEMRMAWLWGQLTPIPFLILGNILLNSLMTLRTSILITSLQKTYMISVTLMVINIS